MAGSGHSIGLQERNALLHNIPVVALIFITDALHMLIDLSLECPSRMLYIPKTTIPNYIRLSSRHYTSDEATVIENLAAFWFAGASIRRCVDDTLPFHQ